MNIEITHVAIMKNRILEEVEKDFGRKLTKEEESLIWKGAVKGIKEGTKYADIFYGYGYVKTR